MWLVSTVQIQDSSIVTESSIEQRYCRLFAIIILNFFNSIGIRALEEYFLEIDLLLF